MKTMAEAFLLETYTVLFFLFCKVGGWAIHHVGSDSAGKAS
jgi:hypothetical protein